MQKSAAIKNVGPQASGSARKSPFSQIRILPTSISSSARQSKLSSKVVSGRGMDSRNYQDSGNSEDGGRDDSSADNIQPQRPSLSGTHSSRISSKPEERRTRKPTRSRIDRPRPKDFDNFEERSTGFQTRSYKSLIGAARERHLQQQQQAVLNRHEDSEAGLLQRILHALSAPAPILSSPFPRSISQALSPRPLPDLLQYRPKENIEDDNARQPGSSFIGARKILRRSCRWKKGSRAAVRDRTKKIRLRAKADLVRVISRSPSPKAQSEPPRENRRKLLRMMRESQAVYEASQSASSEERRKDVQKRANEYLRHRPVTPSLTDDISDDHQDTMHGAHMGKMEKR
ncbi:hypothetical protein BIW11_03578, partial [Tropilaelaps mercedesae]